MSHPLGIAVQVATLQEEHSRLNARATDASDAMSAARAEAEILRISLDKASAQKSELTKAKDKSAAQVGACANYAVTL